MDREASSHVTSEVQAGPQGTGRRNFAAVLKVERPIKILLDLIVVVSRHNEGFALLLQLVKHVGNQALSVDVNRSKRFVEQQKVSLLNQGSSQ